MSWLTKAAADLLYSALGHLHDDRYALLEHDHEDLYSLLSHLHTGIYAPVAHAHGAGYTLSGGAGTWSPADVATYYFGSGFGVAPTSGLGSRLYIPAAGVIKAVYVYWAAAGVAGSTGSITVNMFLNDANPVLIKAVSNTSAAKVFDRTDLNVPVVQGDYIEFQIVCPTWTTNPTNVRMACTVFVE